MEVKSRCVTISDMEGIAHTVEVTAATLYEAVALGLKQLQGNEWVENIAGSFNEVCVSVKSVQVEHRVKMAEFKKWPERQGGSPADMTRRRKVRVWWTFCWRAVIYRVIATVAVSFPLGWTMGFLAAAAHGLSTSGRFDGIDSYYRGRCRANEEFHPAWHLL